MRRRVVLAALVVLMWPLAAPAGAQSGAAPPGPPRPPSSRTQYPPLLRNSYITFQVGAIDAPFSNRQLQPGIQPGTVDTPRLSVRTVLFGHEFTRYFSAQAVYFRPVRFVAYRDVNGQGGRHTVRLAFGGLSARPQLPLGGRATLFGEVGAGVTSRSGFDIGTAPGVPDANFWTAFYGGGADVQVTRAWDLTAGVIYVPGSDTEKQPRTVAATGGFRYVLRPLPAERVAENREAGFFFPARIAQVEITGGAGYGVNRFVSKQVPVFWEGDVRIDRGLAVHYEHNLYHSKKLFAFDLGASASWWRSGIARDRLVTLSVYPLLRFVFLRTGPADVYFQYSIAAPTFISRAVIDGQVTGRRFTFQDFMGLGAVVGAGRRVSLGLKITHYSNGNLIVRNPGLAIPLTATFGFVF